ncbi:hypothetical protein B0H11DRAFT_2024615 [Mycena galericulata]|nr:hypothetical protein B0H11DRAFT_2024615 [Mycena galericulata]
MVSKHRTSTPRRRRGRSRSPSQQTLAALPARKRVYRRGASNEKENERSSQTRVGKRASSPSEDTPTKCPRLEATPVVSPSKLFDNPTPTPPPPPDEGQGSAVADPESESNSSSQVSSGEGDDSDMGNFIVPDHESEAGTESESNSSSQEGLVGNGQAGSFINDQGKRARSPSEDPPIGQGEAKRPRLEATAVVSPSKLFEYATPTPSPPDEGKGSAEGSAEADPASRSKSGSQTSSIEGYDTDGFINDESDPATPEAARKEAVDGDASASQESRETSSVEENANDSLDSDADTPSSPQDSQQKGSSSDEGSRSDKQALKDCFNASMQYITHICVDPELRYLKPEDKEYFEQETRRMENRSSALGEKILSEKCKPGYKSTLTERWDVEFTEHTGPLPGHCAGCWQRGKHTCDTNGYRKMVSNKGTYDRNTLERKEEQHHMYITNTNIAKNNAEARLIPYDHETSVIVGALCAERATFFHDTVHFRFKACERIRRLYKKYKLPKDDPETAFEKILEGGHLKSVSALNFRDCRINSLAHPGTAVEEVRRIRGDIQCVG